MSKKSLGERRLLALADHLETVDRKKFDMGRWAKFKYSVHDDEQRERIPGRVKHLGDDSYQRDFHACGTVACALGWGTTMPSLRRAGLRLIEDFCGDADIALVKKGEASTFGAAEVGTKLFGINYTRFYQMFVPGDLFLPVNTPKQAAKNIRAVVRLIKGNEGFDF